MHYNFHISFSCPPKTRSEIFLKKLFFAVSLITVVLFAGIAAAEPPKDSEGCYVLESAEQLKWFRDEVNRGKSNLNAVLAGDIDLGGQIWVPIGISEQTPYNGSFDGNGHLIRSFRVSGGAALGLFGCVDFGSNITGLKIENAMIIFDGDATPNAAAIAGISRGIIQNCAVAKSEIRSVVGASLPKAIYAGAIAGINEEGVIIDCVSSQNSIRLDNKHKNDEIAAAGGICGVNVGTVPKVGLIMNCESISNEIILTIESSQMSGFGGGIVGLALGGIIRQSQVRGGRLDTRSFSGSVSSLGGIIGSSMHSSYIENCHVGSDILIRAAGGSAESNLGAVAGDLLGSNVSGCSVKNVIISAAGELPHNIGGIAGVFAGGKISDCRISGLLLPRNKEGFFHIGAVVGAALNIETMNSPSETIIENTFFQSSITAAPLGINETSAEVGAFPFDVNISPDLRP